MNLENSVISCSEPTDLHYTVTVTAALRAPAGPKVTAESESGTGVPVTAAAAGPGVH